MVLRIISSVTENRVRALGELYARFRVLRVK